MGLKEAKPLVFSSHAQALVTPLVTIGYPCPCANQSSNKSSVIKNRKPFVKTGKHVASVKPFDKRQRALE